MTLKERQRRLDEEKWYRSVHLGYDCCGEFSYCGFCVKTEEYPCAKAWNRMEDQKKVTKKIAKKAPAKAAPAAKPAVSAELNAVAAETAVKAAGKKVPVKKAPAKKK